MRHVDALIAELAPNGVEFKALGDFTKLVRGNGMPKVDLTDAGVGAIHYGQIYTMYGAWATTTFSFVTPDTAAKLAKADPGDIIITNTSENLDDVGKAVAWLGDKQIVTGGHATIIKHDLEPKYLSYWFQSPAFYAQKRALATGTKVIDVSARQLAKVRIPVPPLEVQREIVRILDQFAELEVGLKAELEAELEARRRQYAYYRDSLLMAGEKDIAAWKPLGELYDPSSGLSKSASQFGFGQPFLSFKTVFNNQVIPPELSNLVNSTEAEQARYSIRAGDVFVTRTSEDLEGLGRSCAALRDYPRATFNGFTKRLRPKEAGAIEAQFAAYFFRSSLFKAQIARMAVLSTRISLNDDILLRVRIPAPPIQAQKRVIAILNKLDARSNELSVGLPGEVAVRRKQYEYYRDGLLTFDAATA
ncbi:restriction endonuclease subunit S [Mycobacteroides franklinii]|uniref:Putative type-1 restriction enzyme specificity protein n=1 Tax=Mycobacteroides franklinii TaxID=948102 RepID=A0A4V3HVE7_9MYCO|nr:restriction endonuclease subunit S [Mycobacteroides franklinii]TDZ41725.1 putative type-1 restriction enzyme specificity protein [Mycobacteroides franklinii]TDZ51873.1 putative type-1 restriction enzyme specificity protein [Mycobacteroides franklinii]TDZ55280.1 putative type-1 restriction enzyme specificity protein [Mycobacteroides franklinii]TDZ62221.1 putative type-1 restriction enzyme specificity protein [Mycobacteroides franklinii]TDZ68618.1 putative type-1 restriction enzyme specificit